MNPIEDDDVPRVLARNTACHQCRKRKLKCDAIKPTCGHCLKPRVRGAAAAEPAEQCTWDPSKSHAKRSADKESPNGEPSSSIKRSRLDELEARLAMYENLASAPNLASSSKQPQAVPAVSLPAPPPATYVAEITETVNWPTLTQRDVGATSSQHQALGGSAGALNLNNAGSGLTWPDWPRDLPNITVVQHIVGVFFEKVPTLPKMLHKASFMSALQLPPSHYGFPCRALMHAILSVTANQISEAALSSRAYFPVGTPLTFFEHPVDDLPASEDVIRLLGYGSGWREHATSHLARFQLWHRRKAFEGCPEYFDRGEKLLQCVQAHVIAATVDQYNAWWVDLWMEAGACVRMAVPLCLNESKVVHPNALQHANMKQMLRPPMTAHEQAERDRTWWMVYHLERCVTFSTCWPPALDDDEITVELPVLQRNYDTMTGDMIGVQTLQSPDLFSAHPPQHMDSFNLLVKAYKLQSDVNKWFRRYMKGEHSVSKYAADPGLRTLLSKIHAFRLSCPAHLRKPTQALNGSLDVDLLTAFMVTHAASIALAEPMVTAETWTHDIARMCLAAVRAVLSLLYEVTATSFDLTLLPPSASWVWSISTRCLCRFIAAALASGDTVSVEVFRSEVEVFRLALSQYGERFPIGQRHLKMVDDVYCRDLPFDVNAVSVMICRADDVFNRNTRPLPHVPASIVSLGTSPSNAAASGSLGFAPSLTTGSSQPSPSPLSIPGLDLSMSATDGFDISSFSFDFDALADLFSGSDAVFNGSDFVQK